MNSLTIAFERLLNIIITFMPNPVCPPSLKAAGSFFSGSWILEYSVPLMSHAGSHWICLINNVSNSCLNDVGQQMNTVSCYLYLPM